MPFLNNNEHKAYNNYQDNNKLERIQWARPRTFSDSDKSFSGENKNELLFMVITGGHFLSVLVFIKFTLFGIFSLGMNNRMSLTACYNLNCNYFYVICKIGFRNYSASA